NYLKEKAPLIRLNIRPITPETSYQMANGEIDLAIGFLPQLEEGFYQQKFFRQHYVVISSKSHPRLDPNNFTLEDYMRESH
ncbi:LysR substrate-binding domain-containing protein, partial [Acinetobacter pittii]